MINSDDATKSHMTPQESSMMGTGICKDPWANAHRVKVAKNKPDKERGYYMYPELYGQPAEKGISRLLFPKEKQE